MRLSHLLSLLAAACLMPACYSPSAPQAGGDVPAAGKGQIAFVANVSGNWDLFIMGADGSGVKRLTGSPLDERTPAISPDGGRVAYSTSDGALWVLSLASGAPEPVPLPPNRYGYPTWLADGGGIVYTVYKFEPGFEDADFFVYRFGEQSARPFLVQTGPQDYPSLSPDAGALAYISSLATSVHGFGNTLTQQLWVASLKEGQPRQLLVGSASDTRPAWSRDARRIAFSSGRAGGPDLWAINADGQELTRLTDGPAAETSPTWSPDGQSVVYVSTEGGRMHLMLLDLRTRESRPLAPQSLGEAEAKDPCWR
jgi:TolB protein